VRQVGGSDVGAVPTPPDYLGVKVPFHEAYLCPRRPPCEQRAQERWADRTFLVEQAVERDPERLLLADLEQGVIAAFGVGDRRIDLGTEGRGAIRDVGE